jgi:predicted PurR-regulated permease PerM
MNQIIGSLQTLKLPKFITVFLVAFAFLVIPAFCYNPSIQAQAEPLTPEATQYQVNSKDSPFRENEQEKVNQIFEDTKKPQAASETTKEIGENLNKAPKAAKRTLEDVAENIKEKLNLDQPLYPGTKEVLDDAANAVRGD